MIGFYLQAPIPQECTFEDCFRDPSNDQLHAKFALQTMVERKAFFRVAAESARGLSPIKLDYMENYKEFCRYLDTTILFVHECNVG